MKTFVARCLSLFIVAFASASVADGGDSIFVKEIEGRGKDHQAALADAFQNAIRKALGTYVVTHATTDGETLDEKIYLNSDAVVKNYKVVGREDGEGFVLLLIDAEIIRNEMMKYIRREPAVEVGEGELANLLAKRKSIENAVKSLDLLFLNWQENVYRAEKCGSFSIAANDSGDEDLIQISVPFILTLRWDAYRMFQKKLEGLLSRIAIDQTSGEAQNEEQMEKAYNSFFAGTGIVKEDRWNNRKVVNPNEYGAVLFLTRQGGAKIRYALFLVPAQIDKKLHELLSPDVDVCFEFRSAGGLVSSQSFRGYMRMFTGSLLLRYDLSSVWWDHHGGCLVFHDSILTEFNNNDEWSARRLFHATVPVSEKDAHRITGCIIQVRSRSKDDRCRHKTDIRSEPISDTEWLRIDPGPQGGSNPSARPNSSQDGASAGKSEGQTVKSKSSEPLPGFDKVLNALTNARDSPTFDNIVALENCWGALPKALRPMLQTNILNASCASFLARGNTSAVAKRKDRIDSAALWAAVTDECRACHGSGRSETKCFACGGSGVCSNCRGRGKLGGGKPLRGMSSEAASMRCSRCNGTGRCQSCTNGQRKTTCTKCDGKGRIVSKAKCKAFFEQNIDQAIRICYGAE